MKIVTFLEKCEVLVTEEGLPAVWKLPQVFFPGDELEVDRIESTGPDEVTVYFVTGAYGVIPADAFTLTDTEQEG